MPGRRVGALKREGRRGAAVACILKGYPRLSETFIAQEIKGLEDHGIDIRIFSMRLPTDGAIHPVRGVLPMALRASHAGLDGCLLAPGNTAEAAILEALAVYPVVVEDGRILIEVPDGPLEISE